MATELELSCLQKLSEQFFYAKLGRNGVCKLFDSSNEYSRVAYKDPATGRRTTATVGRAVVMLRESTVFLQSGFDASHLCHNKACVLPEHISYEPHAVNNGRKTCVNEGMCLGHGQYPDCLVSLKMW